MKFILGNGKQWREKSQKALGVKASEFGSSEIMVVCLNYDEIVGACGVGGMFGMCAEYVKKEYRGQGIGTQAFKKMIEVARRQGLDFISGSPHPDNAVILHILRKLGFREIVRFPEYILMMLPLTFKGEIVYSLLCMVFTKLPNNFLDHALAFLRKMKQYLPYSISGYNSG